MSVTVISGVMFGFRPPVQGGAHDSKPNDSGRANWGFIGLGLGSMVAVWGFQELVVEGGRVSGMSAVSYGPSLEDFVCGDTPLPLKCTHCRNVPQVVIIGQGRMIESRGLRGESGTTIH